jgi:HEAT repeat protein
MLYLKMLEEKIKNGEQRNLIIALNNMSRVINNQDTAKIILELLILSDNDDSYEYILEESNIKYWITENCIDLLKKGMKSKNKDLRAFCVYHLKKLNYQYSKDELDRLINDDYWKVRANIAEIDKSYINETDNDIYLKLLRLF